MDNIVAKKYVDFMSRCTAMFFGGMAILLLMNETLYLTNIKYPYVAQILAFICLLLLYALEAFKERLV
ncbi:hypothetical protein SDC9_117927 [bioreactor metagenome]|uniref:Uncharacterized protein n=1 Tax=bioreactor metagenome TaxID=1076179 RepID=A0A645C8M7_9ZZZZ